MNYAKYITKLLCFFQIVLFVIVATVSVHGQIADRPRPDEWKNLVFGGRFMDRFEPMPAGTLSKETWGADNVIPRYVDNGIEDRKYSYWGTNIVRDSNGKYHMFICTWLESAPRGHRSWVDSFVLHAVCDNPVGAFKLVSEKPIADGYNPEVFQLKDGRYILYVCDKKGTQFYVTKDLDGEWKKITAKFDRRDRPINDGLTNQTFSVREDGSVLMVCRGGGVWICPPPYDSLTFYQITEQSVYPQVEGKRDFEDPVVWRDNVQYHIIVNDWRGRIAYYLRSKDGVKWVADSGEAYMPGIAKHADGTQEDWFKYERIRIFQDKFGRAVQANFAVIDVLKPEDKANDNHSSKNIAIPLNAGLLLTILNEQPITLETKTIRVKIAAENGFNPQTDVDTDSLRFGASTEVDFGRGCKVQSSEKDGVDLVVTFNANGNGITADEFAPKLIGKTTKGKLLYGYARLPSVSYIEPIVSARLPVFVQNTNDTNVSIEVRNFGQVASPETTLRLKDNGKLLGEIKIQPLKPYEKNNVSFTVKPFEKEREYNLTVVIISQDIVNKAPTEKILSTFDFKYSVKK
jgi:hypothetical protein